MSIHHNTAIAAVNTLESLGYTYNEGAELWTPPLDMECKDAEIARLTAERDKLAIPKPAKLDLVRGVKANAFDNLARCIRDPNQIKQQGLTDLEGVVRWHERHLQQLPTPQPDEEDTRMSEAAMDMAAMVIDPAKMDREALVRLLQIITRNGSFDDGRTLHEVIADALLAYRK